MVMGHVALFGITNDTDEGTAAHIFQMLMIAQVPFVAFFAFKWLPDRPTPTLLVLSLQTIVGLSAIAAVYFLT
jgi:hypothetical protein